MGIDGVRIWGWSGGLPLDAGFFGAYSQGDRVSAATGAVWRYLRINQTDLQAQASSALGNSSKKCDRVRKEGGAEQ
jgi:hypothetical protein